MIHLGNVPASTVLYVPFTTYAGATGASITCSGLAVTDIEIYKNGSVTQRASDAGYALLDTDGIDFDGITGLHGFSIDLADNTDAGFFTVGAWYWVVVSAITVDSQTVTFLAATFRIAPAEALTGHPKTDVGGWLGTAPATPTVNGVPEVDITHLLGTAWLTPAVAGTPDVNTKTITAGAINAAAIGTDAIDADALKADAVTEIQSGLATAAQINSLQVNTRANLQVPIEIETPDAGTQIYKIRLFLFDVEGNMEAADSTPTITLTNAAGTDRSSRLSVASNPSTGVYSWDYTATAGDAEEQLVWTFTVVEGALTRVYPATSYVVEETAYRFSSSDRANLQSVLADTNELQTDWVDGGRLDLILDARASQASVDDVPTNAELATALGTADDAVLAAIAAEAVKTAAIKTVTDKVDTGLVQDGGVYQFTVNMLELGPSGSGAGSNSPGAY